MPREQIYGTKTKTFGGKEFIITDDLPTEYQARARADYFQRRGRPARIEKEGERYEVYALAPWETARMSSSY